MSNKYNPQKRKIRFIGGVVKDVWRLGESRRIAGEIDILAELLENPDADRQLESEAEPLFWILPTTKSRLSRALENRALAPMPTEICFGGPHLETRPPDTLATPVVEVATTVAAAPAPSPVAAPPKPQSPPTNVAAAFSRATLEAAIGLADWLQRASSDERITKERALDTAVRKTHQLLAALGIERIERGGEFDSTDQEISDSVSTSELEQEGHIAETIEPGYRAGNALIRPQKVLVFRYSRLGKEESGL